MSSGVQIKGRTVFNNSDINTPDIDNPDIDGGTADSISVGSGTPASGEFTTLKASTDPVDEHGVGDRGFNDGRYIPNPLTAQLGIGEYDLKLDSLLSADGKYSGITCDGVLGATIAFGDLVYLNTADQRWELADADAEATAGDVMLAIVLAGGDDGDTRLLLLQGFIREDDWNFTSYGQAMFVGLTAGDMVQDVSGYTTGDIVRVIGHASTFADQIYFNPDGTWLEVA